MPKPTVVVVDATQDADISNEEIQNINNLVNRVEKQDENLFYLLPEGEPLHESVEEGTVSSILRYDPETEDPYQQARIDEQINGRDIEQVQFYPDNEKGGKFSNKEKERGRSAYAGPPDHSNAPPWAGPSGDKGNNGNGNKGGNGGKGNNGNGNKGGNGGKGNNGNGKGNKK